MELHVKKLRETSELSSKYHVKCFGDESVIIPD